MAYNASFAFEDQEFGIYLTDIKWSWKLDVKTASDARQAHTVYPYRVELYSPTIQIAFESPQRFFDFGSFIRKYSQAATSDATSTIGLRFRTFGDGATIHGGIDWDVTFEDTEISRKFDDVVPVISIGLILLNDRRALYGEWGATATSASTTTGTVGDLTKKVSPDQISNAGDSAFHAGTGI